MDWDSYYEKFYDWATSTQIKKMSSLTSFGASAEVSEVAQEYMDEKAASRLIKKAVAYGVQFTPDEIYDLSGCCDISAMNELLKSAKCTFTQEQLEDLWGSADDEVLELVARRNHVTVFADDENEAPSVEDEIDFDEPKQKEPSSDSSQSSGWHLRLEVFWIRKASLTTDIVPVTAQIALRIMGIAMEGGIMGMIIHTAVSLAEIKAEADCKAQDENKHTAFRLNVIGGAHG